MSDGGAVAAIDCGTNSTRLLIADATGAPLQRLMRITRLGQGVDADGRLAPEAIARTVEVLRDYRRSMDELGVARVRMVATSAVRDAANGATFGDEATAAVGRPPEVLTGTMEGELSYRGASADLAPMDGDTVVMDIGGGSTELSLGRNGTIASVSLQLGCVRLTERYLRGDPPGPDEVAATRAAITQALGEAEGTVPQLAALAAQRRLVGLAGTVSTLTGMQLGVAAYDAEQLHHAAISRGDVEALCVQLGSLTMSERAALVGMVEGREDVILGGALVLEAVMARYGFDEVMYSERDILDGIVLSLL
jgi:exopolyphosphatase/guanosine-5'-triphosphate,3'-diphosphate pyrophosphatase